MKVCFGSQIIFGPWGGGNLFLINLQKFLIDSGHEVVFNLNDSDIDIILFTDPRRGRGTTSTINARSIKKYKKKVNSNVKIVQRINECDERKNTSNINSTYLKSTEVSDHIVFVSNWLQNIYLELGLDQKKTSVILSGSDKNIFNSLGKTEKPIDRRYKIVTHHWSSNWMKGFDLYLHIDKLLDSPELRNKLEFTYIGNIDKSLTFKNTNIIPPLTGVELAAKLKENDIYVTGSINEPSGNHHIEAALCGLPILYVRSGGIPEYCKEYGLEVTKDNFIEKVLYMIEYYQKFKNNLRNYPFDSEKMCMDYLNLFKKMLNQ